MGKRWRVLTASEDKIDDLQKMLKVSRTLCKIFVQRGITEFDDAKDFFRPRLSSLHDPFLMKDMDKAVRRVRQAIEQKERILVFGDYDVDGTSSVASMFQFLHQLYTNIDFYIPHRYREGYGVSRQGIDFAHENNCSLIVSLDCGIKSVELVGYAKTLGIEFIICDHHTPDDELPPAYAILNPKQKDCTYPYKELCGCGVGFKFMQGLAQYLHLPEESYLQYLDLVVTAIAADIVPITGENRILAFYGLKKINEAPCPGIKGLLQLSKLCGNTVYINNLVFAIAPKINAAGRMDDARKAVLLFMEQDEKEVLKIAEHLQNDNSERKKVDENITTEALSIISNDATFAHRKTTVLFQEHWHKGVVGIVASRLVDNYYRPTVVLTKSGDIVAGSARSVSGFNLYDAVHACRKHLLGYGGHFAAAGMTLLPEQVEAFRNKFEEVVSATIPDKLLIPEVVIDAEVNFAELSLAFYNMLSQMEPFGPDNSRPIFIAKRVIDTGYSKIVKENHIRFTLKQNGTLINGIGFNMADKFQLLQNHTPVDIVFTLDINEWNNEKHIQVKVIDFKIS